MDSLPLIPVRFQGVEDGQERRAVHSGVCFFSLVFAFLLFFSFLFFFLAFSTVLIRLTAFFAKYGQRHPVYAPWTTPGYSNIGFAILGMVIESVTHQSYEDYIQKAIIEPLNLSRTGFSAPTDSNVVDVPWFGTDLGIEDPYVLDNSFNVF
jgi:hypothetical protein